MIPLSFSAEPTRPTAIPSFHPHISPFHRDAPIEFDATVDVIREIHFSYEVVFPVVIVDVGWWWIPGDSFHTDGSRWSWDGGGHHFTDLVPRTFSFLVPLLSFSLFFVAALYENEKVTSYQRDRASLSTLPLSRSVCSLLSLSCGLFLVSFLPRCYPQPFLSRLQCTLVIRCDEGIRVQT